MRHIIYVHCYVVVPLLGSSTDFFLSLFSLHISSISLGSIVNSTSYGPPYRRYIQIYFGIWDSGSNSREVSSFKGLFL